MHHRRMPIYKTKYFGIIDKPVKTKNPVMPNMTGFFYGIKYELLHFNVFSNFASSIGPRKLSAITIPFGSINTL
jgi:hypothetical protein